jgi:uncharacterized phosphosugar-binding protein
VLARRFLDGARDALARLSSDALAEIDAAGALTAERLAAGGALHHFDTGHTAREPVRRAGGLVALRAIEPSWTVRHAEPPGREGPSEVARDYWYDVEELGRRVADGAGFAKGDVLWIVSNSGKEPVPVAMALRAKERGCAVVAITCVAFSRSVPARHSSGRRLFEVADRVIDTNGPVGDASLKVDGLDDAICPLSGLLNVAAVWALEAATVEACLARGVKPSVYRSVNLPDGFDRNAAAERRYRDTGR